MNIITIKGVSRAIDCQDGSYSITVFNTKEEMLADFRAERDDDEVSDEDFFNENDPYYNGYLDFNVSIQIDLDTGMLAKPFSMSAG